MRKVLFISYFFPPLGGAGVPRSLKFVKYLPEFGWLPTVVSAGESVSYMKDYSLLKEIPKEIEVNRIGHREARLPWKLEYLLSRLKIRSHFPDVYKTWFRPAYREAKRILQNGKFDLIFSSSAPYTSHFIAMKLKKEFNIPWIADFRDPWSGNTIGVIYLNQTLILPLRKILQLKIKNSERKILETANKTVVVSWHHRQQLCELHHIPEDMVEVITNGYDESDFEGLNAYALYPDKLTITFIGSFYLGFKEIALKFLDVVKELNKEVEVVFIGRAASDMQNVGHENLTCIYNLPRKKLLTFSLASDFIIIIIMPSSLWWIPGKTFECIRLCKPILAICPEDGDAARIIKEADAGFILSYDKERMKEQLREIFERWERGEFRDFRPNWEYVTQFERRKLTQRLANLFNEIGG